MTTSIQQPALQQRTLRLYGELLCRRSDWAGQLVFSAFAGAAASGLAAAASLAGAASLTADADAALMKTHFRDGAYDFVVNTLDEALRALKNEIRRGRPIAIGLIADPLAVLQDSAERGLAAAFLLSGADGNDDLETSVLQSDGSHVTWNADSPSLKMTSWLHDHDWHMQCLPEATAQGSKAYAETVPEADGIRMRWLRQLPSHQRSVARLPRYVWLTAEERAQPAASR